MELQRLTATLLQALAMAISVLLQNVCLLQTRMIMNKKLFKLGHNTLFIQSFELQIHSYIYNVDADTDTDI